MMVNIACVTHNAHRTSTLNLLNHNVRLILTQDLLFMLDLINEIEESKEG